MVFGNDVFCFNPRSSRGRYYDCRQYDDCLHTAARMNLFLDCGVCKKYVPEAKPYEHARWPLERTETIRPRQSNTYAGPDLRPLMKRRGVMLKDLAAATGLPLATAGRVARGYRLRERTYLQAKPFLDGLGVRFYKEGE